MNRPTNANVRGGPTTATNGEGVDGMTDKQWVIGGYDGREVLSAFRKEVVLGDVDHAVYWANVVLTFGGNRHIGSSQSSAGSS
jgi:hypothetical protein